MIKSSKCYGRKNIIRKEKSFIKNFFDGNGSPGTSFMDTGEKYSEKKIEGDPFKYNKQSVAASPNLYHSIYEDSFKDKFLDESLSNENFNTNAQGAVKKKNVKRKKYVRKKQIIHSTKFYKSIQPNWSEFYKHKLTVEKHEKHNVCTTRKDNNEAQGTSTRSTTGLRENNNKINISQAESTKTPNHLQIHKLYNFDSSGELFLPNYKEKRNVKRKKGVCNSKENYNENHVKTIEQESEVDFSQHLPELSGADAFEKNKNVLEYPYDKKQSKRNTVFEVSPIPVPDSQTALQMPNRKSTNECIINNVENNVLMNKSVLKDNLFPTTTVDFDSVNILPDELQNLQNYDETSKGKFTTSTPIIKSKLKNVILASFLCNERSKFTTLSSRKSCLIFEKQVADCSMNHNKANQNSSSLHLNSLFYDHAKKSLQFECPVACRPNKALTLPNKSSVNASKGNRSLLNVSSSFEPPPGVSDEVLKSKLLKLCNQNSVEPFASIYDWNNFKVQKIGEGTYGEVFKLVKGKTSSVIKIIAVSERADDKFQSLQSVVSEVEISKCLGDLRNNIRNQTRNFSKVHKASAVCGLYPSILLDAWDNFSAKSCYNERPDYMREDQLFVILELEFGGKDMSCFVLRNAVEAESILKQVTLSLAIAEEEFLFEHRDLHLGNILVQRNRRKTLTYILRGHQIDINCHGLEITIIDFTLSRLFKDGVVYYNDLASDYSLFEQSGDYQFEVYKSMKRHLENKWEDCSLYSNVLWLKFLCFKFMEYNYSRPSTQAHKKGLKFVESFNSHLSGCDCAIECLTKCEITTHLFKKSILDKNHTKKSILIATNSFQKSKNSICN